MDSKSDQRRLHPLAWAGIVGGGLIGLALVILIAAMLAVLRDSQQHIRSQDAKVTALYNGTRQALGEARPAAGQIGPLARDARSTLRALSAASPDVVDAAQAVPPLLRAGQALASVTIPLLRDLAGVGTARVVADAGTLLVQIRSADLIEKAARGADAVPELLVMQKRLLRLQVQALRIQRRSLATQLTTLEAQQQALAHIESIDRKTGGQVPATPVPAVAAP